MRCLLVFTFLLLPIKCYAQSLPPLILQILQALQQMHDCSSCLQVMIPLQTLAQQGDAAFVTGFTQLCDAVHVSCNPFGELLTVVQRRQILTFAQASSMAPVPFSHMIFARSTRLAKLRVRSVMLYLGPVLRKPSSRSKFLSLSRVTESANNWFLITNLRNPSKWCTSAMSI